MRNSPTVNFILDPGVGPSLQYSEVNSHVNLSCSVERVFPEPELTLDWIAEIKDDNNTLKSVDEYRYTIF